MKGKCRENSIARSCCVSLRRSFRRLRDRPRTEVGLQGVPVRQPA
jgi:hypothetical protein